MKSQTCCFTGHRILPKQSIDHIREALDREIDNLYRQGVTEFLSGGALGFDQLAASLVIAKKKRCKGMHLLFALPCKHQDARWTVEQQRRYWDLLSQGDAITFVSHTYQPGCMEKRNRYMVERSGHCLCALLRPHSGTGQTVRLARAAGLRIINVCNG